jgi:hypothetical protein
MGEKIKCKMLVSIASEDWSAQPGEVHMIDSVLAKKWIKGGVIAERAAPDAPLTSSNDLLRDLSLIEARNGPCRWCYRRGTHVLGNFPYCRAHFRSQYAADFGSEI